MSRTYRRMRGNQWWHNNIVKRWTDDPEYGGRRRTPKVENFELTMEKELARYHSDAGWAMNNPSWWVLQEMTVPQRQEVRRLIHKVFRLPMEDVAELMFPLAKKPHEYYW
jgi:hypothetical protein